MKKLAGLFAVMFLGIATVASARMAPNVFLDVQVSSNAAPGALVKGAVTILGTSSVVQGTTNISGHVTLPFSISVATAAPVIPASFYVKGQGTNGFNSIYGNTSGNFNFVPSTPSTHIPIFLLLH